MEKIMDKELKELISVELDRVFKKAFMLTDKDIKKYIERILDEKDEEVILTLSDFFLKFEKYNQTVYSVERSRAGRTVLDRCIKMYLANKEKIKDNFFVAMDFAQKQKIDPVKIATMENLRGLTAQIYKNTYNTLTQMEYENPITGKTSKLLNDEDFKALIENCASVICHVSEENVKEVVSILDRFSYDKESGTFCANVSDMIKRCGTILTYPSEKLASNIAFLKSNFVPPMTEAELVVRISKSPSILLCDQAKINNFEKCIYQNLVELKRENPILFPQGDAFEAFAVSYAHNATFNIDKISSITGLTKENLEKFSDTKNVLVKYLGAKNAFETFTDFNVLSIEPRILDGLLARLTQYDYENNTFLRKFFIEHTARALNLLQEEQLPSGPSKKTGRTVTPRRVRADLESMPKSVDVERSLSNSDQKTVNSLFENVKMTFEARKIRKIVDGVVQLSEEEQEEQEYMQELFDRIQNDFDTSKCKNSFDEVVLRIEAIIDAKEGKGFADRRFEINKMRHLNNIYLKACYDAKTLCGQLYPIFAETSKLEDFSKDVSDRSAVQYLSACEDFRKIMKKFTPLFDKVEDVTTTIQRYVNWECKKIFKSIGLPSNTTPDKNGDFYYEEDWFEKDHNCTLLLIGMTVSQTQLAYCQFLRDYVQSIVANAEENTLYSMAIDTFGSQQIDFRYNLYATRMRAFIMNSFYGIAENLKTPLVLSGLIEGNQAKSNIVDLYGKIKTDINKFMEMCPTSKFEMYGRDTHKVVSQLRSSNAVAKDGLIAMRNAYSELHFLNQKVKKVLSKKHLGNLMDEYDCVGDMLHTKAGLLLFPYAESKIAVFMAEPEVEENTQQIEALGVGLVRDKDLKDVSIINYTNSETFFSEKDEKAILPVKFKDEGK